MPKAGGHFKSDLPFNKLHNNYSITGADKHLTDNIQVVWDKVSEAKAVMQRLDRRVDQSMQPLKQDSPRSSKVKPSAQKMRSSLSSKAGKGSTPRNYSCRVGFREPLISYHAEHDPYLASLSLTGANNSELASNPGLSESTTGKRPAITDRRQLADSQRVATNPPSLQASLPKPTAALMDTYRVSGAEEKADTPSEHPAQTRELNPAGIDAAPNIAGSRTTIGKDLKSAGVAETVRHGDTRQVQIGKRRMADGGGEMLVPTGPYDLACFSPDTTFYANRSPFRKFDMSKRRKRLEENSELLAKLKDTIQKQKENRSPTGSAFLNRIKHSDDEPIKMQDLPPADEKPPCMRKTAMGPAAPKYKGFSTAETRLRTPDGKVWKEDGDDFTHSHRVYKPDVGKTHPKALKFSGDKSSCVGKPITSRKLSKSHNKSKATVRKTGSIKSDNPSYQKTIITPSSWREGKRLAEAVLGSPPKQPRSSRAQVSRSPPTRDYDVKQAGEQPAETGTGAAVEVGDSAAGGDDVIPTAADPTGGEATNDGGDKPAFSVDINLGGLPGEIKDMLADLNMSQSSDSSDGDNSTPRNPATPRSATATGSKVSTDRKRKPTKKSNAAKASSTPALPVEKTRHYDPSQVQKYMLQQKEQRRRKRAEERRAEKEAEDRKQQQLDALDRRQREARTKQQSQLNSSQSAKARRAKSLQETFTKPQPGRFVGASQPGGGEYRDRLAAFMDKLDRIKSDTSTRNEPDPDPTSPRTTTQVSKFMTKLDLYLNEDDAGAVEEQLSASAAPASARRSSSSSALSEPEVIPPHSSGPVVAWASTPNGSPQHQQQVTSHMSPVTSHKSPRAGEEKVDRIAALRAKSESLQKRIEMESQRLTKFAATGGANSFFSSNRTRPLSAGSERSPPKQATMTSRSADYDRDRFATSALSHRPIAPRHDDSDVTSVDSLPGVANLSAHAKTGEAERTQSEAANKIQAAYRGHSVSEFPTSFTTCLLTCDRNALETWELPSGRSLSSAVRHHHVTSDEEDGHVTATDDDAPLPHRPVDVILSELKEHAFCAADPPVVTRKWAHPRDDDDDDVIIDEGEQRRKGEELLEDLRARITRPSPHKQPTDDLGAAGKPPWKRGNGDKYSVVNVFARKYLKQLNRKQRDADASGSDDGRRTKVRSSPSTPRADHRDGGNDDNRKRAKSHERARHHRPPASADDTPRSSSSLSVDRNKRKKSKKTATQTDDVKKDASSDGYDPLGLITWSKTLGENRDVSKRVEQIMEQDADVSAPGIDLPPAALFEQPAAAAVGAGGQQPPRFEQPAAAAVGAGGQQPPRFSPAVLEHKMALELGRIDSIESALKQLNGTERTQAVALAQQETVSLSHILQTRQQQHEVEMERLALKAKEEAVKMNQQVQEAAAATHEEREKLADERHKMALQLQEETRKTLKHQMEAAKAARSETRPPARGLRTYSSDERTSEDTTTRTSSVSSKAESKRTYDSSSTMTASSPVVVRKPARKTSSILSEHSTTSVRPGSDSSIAEHIVTDTSDTGKSISEATDVQPVAADDSDRSISEEIDDVSSNKSPAADKRKRAGDTSDESIASMLDAAAAFDEDQMAEISRKAVLPFESHRRHQRKKTAGGSSGLEHSDYSLSSDEASPHAALMKGRFPPAPASELSPTSLFGEADIGSFSQFMGVAVQQYMVEQQVRARHHDLLLNLREKAVKEKAQTDLQWLEQRKQHLRNKGDDDKMPPLMKKKRAILRRLQVETEEIKKLKAANKAANKDCELLMKQQQAISRYMQTTKAMKEKLKIKSEAEGKKRGAVVTSDDSMTAETSSPPVHHVTATISSDFDVSEAESDVTSAKTSRLLKGLKKITLDGRHLTMREKALLKRKKEAERLLQWKKQLDEEEKRVYSMERQAISVWSGVPGDKPPVAADKKPETDSATSINIVAKPSTTSTIESSPPSDDVKKHVGSESESSSSIAEDLAAPAEEETSSSTATPNEDGKIGDHRLQDVSSEGTVDDYSQSFESAGTVTPKSDSEKKPTKSDDAAAGKPLKSSSSTRSDLGESQPLLGGKTQATAKQQPVVAGSNGAAGGRKKRDSTESWSDESFSQTQSETEQSDVECRVHALKEELKRRRLVAERLKKQQKKKHKEHLRAQEASLKSQIEAYDAFIRKTQQELNQEMDVAALVTATTTITSSHANIAKPQIRSPRKGEQNRQQARTLRGAVASVASPDASPRAGSQKQMAGAGGLIGKQRSDSESSGRSSRSLSFDDEHQQPPDDVSGSKSRTPLVTSPPEARVSRSNSNNSLIPVAKTSTSQLSLSVKSSSSPATSLKDDVAAKSLMGKDILPDKPKDVSPTSPPSSYSEDFERSSIATEEEVSERLSEVDSNKSDGSVVLLDLNQPHDLPKVDGEVDDTLRDVDDDDKTPVASPCRTPTPHDPLTPTHSDPGDKLLTQGVSHAESVDVSDGTGREHPVTTLDADNDSAPEDERHLVAKSARAPSNEKVADVLSEKLLRDLLEDTVETAISARSNVQATGNLRPVHDTADDVTLQPTERVTDVKRQQPKQPKLSSSAKNLLHLITSSPSSSHDDITQEDDASPRTERDEATATDHLADELLTDTINKVLAIRKQRAKKWAAEKSGASPDHASRDVDHGDELETILQENQTPVRRHPAGASPTASSEDRDSPAFARPVSPIFGASQDDATEDWFYDFEDFGVPPPNLQEKSAEDLDEWKLDQEARKELAARFEPPPIVVPHKPHHVIELVNRAVDHYYVAHLNGELRSGDDDDSPLPDRMFAPFADSDSQEEQPEAAKQADLVFKRSVFHLVRELMIEATDDSANHPQAATWTKSRPKRRPMFCRVKPKTKQDLSVAISAEVSRLFNLDRTTSGRDSRPATHVKWASGKKKDRVDHLLIDELRDEEVEWVDYDMDETTVKLQLADMVFDHVLSDTLRCFDLIDHSRRLRNGDDVIEERSSM